MLALALLAAAAPCALRAEGPGAYIELRAYEAPRGCPGRRLFERRVADRLASSATRPGRTARVRVILSAEGGRVHGTLTLDDGASRRLSGASCREVVEGLALVAALALVGDAAADGGAEPEAAVAPAVESGAEPEAAVAPAAESGAAPGQLVESEGRAEAAPRPANPSRAQGERPSGATAGRERPASTAAAPLPSAAEPAAERSAGAQLGAGLLIFHGLAPKLQPGLQLTAAVAWPLTSLTLSAQLAGRLAAAQTLASAAGDARFGFAGGALIVCAAAALGGGGLSARGCGVAESGALRWSATDTEQARGYTRGWLALGPALSLALRGSWLGAVAGAELLWPTRRDRALLAGDVLLRVPEVCLRLQVGLEVLLDAGP